MISKKTDEIIFNNLTAGNYTIEIFDSFSNENNNTATENIILQEPEPLTITLDNDVDLCGNPDSDNNIQLNCFGDNNG